MNSKEDNSMYRGKLGVFLLLLLVSSLMLVSNFFKGQASQKVQTSLSVRNNLWSHYGNKSIKSKLYELEKNNFTFLSQNAESPKETAILKSLIANLDHEISRYKDEKSEIQSEAVDADTKFELAKRQNSIYSLAFSLALASFLILFCSILTILDGVVFIKAVSILLSVSSAGFIVYGTWFL